MRWNGIVQGVFFWNEFRRLLLPRFRHFSTLLCGFDPGFGNINGAIVKVYGCYKFD